MVRVLRKGNNQRDHSRSPLQIEENESQVDSQIDRSPPLPRIWTANSIWRRVELIVCESACDTTTRSKSPMTMEATSSSGVISTLPQPLQQIIGSGFRPWTEELWQERQRPSLNSL